MAKKIGFDTKNNSNLDGLILLCEKHLPKSYSVYFDLFDLHCFLIFTGKFVSVKLQCNINDLKIKNILRT